MRASRRIEETIFGHGLSIVAGADEAGRGACAGPLVAAAVAVDQDALEKIASSIDLDLGLDSKRFSEALREDLYEIITASVREYQIVVIDASEIDRQGLQQMNLTALRSAIAKLNMSVDYVLTDGYPIAGLDVPSLAVWKGDAISVAVGAASIIAKVTRDRMMVEFDVQFPGYGFAGHKGYSAPSHMKAIEEHGVTPIHRLSYANVARLVRN